MGGWAPILWVWVLQFEHILSLPTITNLLPTLAVRQWEPSHASWGSKEQTWYLGGCKSTMTSEKVSVYS